MRVSDIPIVASWMAATPLWQRYRLTEAKAHAQLDEALTRDDLLLVADVAAPVSAACGLAWCVPRGAFARSGYLKALGVRSEWTGAGLGARLLAETERAVAPSSDELLLLVSDFNTEAQRFYQRQGYAQVGMIPGYVLPDVTELIYWKRLEVEQRRDEGNKHSPDVPKDNWHL